MDVIVAGGGLAGLSAAVALSSLGLSVELYEARPFAGGRATSYHVGDVEIDNCQHILLKCCVNLLNFYERMGVPDAIEFHRSFHFIEPGGRSSEWKRGTLPAPMHFLGSFLRAKWLSWGEKAALGSALFAVMRERGTRQDLDQISMLDWLREKKQPARVIERFWRQVLVSAVNAELDEMAAAHGFQVVWLGFLAAADTYEMGIPRVPLGELYRAEVPGARVALKAVVEEIDPARAAVRVNGEWREAKAVVSALSSDKLQQLLPALPIPFHLFEASSITGIHVWFDRSVTALPHGTLLDRNIQWFFNKDGGRYLLLVVSASEKLLRMSRQEVIDLAIRELQEFLPAVGDAKLVKAHVVKEAKATFKAKPGLETERPGTLTPYEKFFLAGDWTRSGWPATMEGAVRSGYIAAEAVAAYVGKPAKFLLPDVA